MDSPHTCNEIGCRNDAPLMILGVVPGTTFTDGSTYPSQGQRLLGWTCRAHAEKHIHYFTRCGHLDVQTQLTWEGRAARHIYLQQRVSALLADALGSTHGVMLSWGWLDPEQHIRQAAEAAYQRWIQVPMSDEAFRIWRACGNAHMELEQLNEQTPYFHPSAPAILARAHADLAALDT